METHTLREWRAIRAVGVRELARQAGVSTAAIVALEHQRSRGYPRTWKRIAKALGIEPLQIAEYRQRMGRADELDQWLERRRIVSRSEVHDDTPRS